MWNDEEGFDLSFIVYSVFSGCVVWCVSVNCLERFGLVGFGVVGYVWVGFGLVWFGRVRLGMVWVVNGMERVFLGVFFVFVGWILGFDVVWLMVEFRFFYSFCGE